jgi:uncharacterized membrane protein YfhO
MCWPANVVGAFFIAVLIFDMVEKKYGDLPYHALAGVVLTFLFWLICSFVSVSVSGALLIVPATFIIVFLFTIWFMNESLKQRGCCMNCNGNCGKKGRLVKKDSTTTSSISSTSSTNLSSSNSKTPEKCIATLTASTAPVTGS